MHRVLVSLDALLDTRLATVSRIDPQAAKALVAMPEYYTRLIDDFSCVGVSLEQFREAYAQRDTDTLRCSMITQIPFLLNDLISKLEVDEDETPYVENLGLDINIWPYELSTEEADMLVLSVMARAGRQTIPKVVSIPPQDLTPALVKSTYSGLIIYDFRDWLVHHQETFVGLPCPRVTVLAPALFHDRVLTPEDYLTPDMRKDVNPFTLAEVGMLEMFGANFIRPATFSIFHPDYVPKKEEAA